MSEVADIPISKLVHLEGMMNVLARLIKETFGSVQTFGII